MASSPLKGRKSLGNYDLLTELGHGGAGVVYKARHRLTEEIVAIKALLPQQAKNRTALKRFEQEFRSSSPIQHPNLVRALDFQELDGIAFLVMEYVDGRSLGERIELSGTLTPADAVAIVAQIGMALDWLHDHGILHRDVKPDNILVTADGVAKLTDLGLAKELLFDDSLTRTGSALGTPNFMAPEQFRDAKRVDRRADVYSLAATLYQMVTGVIPFQTSTPFEAWVKKAKNEFDPPRQLKPSIPEHIDQAIVRGMSGEPDQRPATCEEFTQLLTLPDVVEEGETWELLFGDPDGRDSVSMSTENVRRLLASNSVRVVGFIFARRNPNDRFKPIERFAEFRDLLASQLGSSPELPPPTATTPALPSRAKLAVRLPLIVMALAVITLLLILLLKK